MILEGLSVIAYYLVTFIFYINNVGNWNPAYFINHP